MTTLTLTEMEVNPSQAAWEMEVRSPGPSLRGTVRDLVGYREQAATPVRRRELPETHIVVILNLGSPLQLLQPNGRREMTVAGGAGSLHDAFSVSRNVSDQQVGLCQ